MRGMKAKLLRKLAKQENTTGETKYFLGRTKKSDFWGTIFCGGLRRTYQDLKHQYTRRNA